jgi:hypothetical protein
MHQSALLLGLTDQCARVADGPILRLFSNVAPRPPLWQHRAPEQNVQTPRLLRFLV